MPRVPEVAIRSCGNPVRCTPRGKWKLGDDAGRGDTSDFIDVGLGEPESTVGPSCNVDRVAARGRRRKLADTAGGRDAADPVRVFLGKPKRTVGPGSDAVHMGV